MFTDEENQQVAETILDQMGGIRRLQMMIDAKHFVFGVKGNDAKVFVQFSYAGTDTRNRANRCNITYTRGRDLYDVEFGIVRQYAFVSRGQFTDIYIDQLCELFERETGLFLTLLPKC